MSRKALDSRSLEFTYPGIAYAIGEVTVLTSCRSRLFLSRILPAAHRHAKCSDRPMTRGTKEKAGHGCPAHSSSCGRGGIRTLDTAKRYSGFRDRPIQPLSHPSRIITYYRRLALAVRSSPILWKHLIQPLAPCSTLEETLPLQSFRLRQKHFSMHKDPGPSSTGKSALPRVVLSKTIQRIHS